MALLLDNDIVHKLAQLDMLDEAINILDVDYGEILVLNTMRYKFCSPSNSAKRSKQDTKYGADVVLRIETFLSKVKMLTDGVTDFELIEAMNNGKDLDMGEMQLLSVLISSKDDNLLFTGDKRFLKALANQSILAEKLNSVQNKFISFEQIMMLLINGLGFDKVQEQVSIAHSNYSFDKTIRCCFEGLPNGEINNVRTNIRQEIIRLTSETGNLLCSETELYSLFPSDTDTDTDNYDFLSDFISIPQN